MTATAYEFKRFTQNETNQKHVACQHHICNPIVVQPSSFLVDNVVTIFDSERMKHSDTGTNIDCFLEVQEAQFGLEDVVHRRFW